MKQRILVLVFLVGVSTLAMPGQAFGCSCMMPEIERTAEEADVIFIGEQVGQLDRGERLVLGVEVVETFKGELPPAIELHTWKSSATCGISFAEAGLVGIAAWDDGDGRLSVNLCGSAWDADVLREFYGGPGDPPVGGGQPIAPPPVANESGSAALAVAVGVAGALVAGLLVRRYRSEGGQSGSS